MSIGIFVVMMGRAAAGPETYERCLVREIARLDTDTEYHVFCLSRGAVEAFQLEQPNIHYHALWPKTRWISMSASLPIQIKRTGIQLLHATFTPPPYCPADYVFTIQGGVTFSHPEFYPPTVLWRLNKLLRRGLDKAKLVLCVSNFVQQEIQDMFKLSPDRLATVYHGVGEEFRPLPPELVKVALRQRYGIERPYVLFVGKLHSNKNIVRLIRAFHSAREEAKLDIQLVLAGKKVWGSDGIDETIEELKLSEDVLILGHQDHASLPLLYNGAMGFVFPSLWEGFGLPVVEAMACGAPVVASNLACFPEITGGAASLVDPYSTEDIAEGIHKILTDAAYSQALRDKGLERARFFSWSNTARQTIQGYHRAIGMD